MEKLLKQFVAILPLFLILFSCQNQKKSKEQPEFPYDKFEIMRGTNIAHWLSQSQRRGPEREVFFTEKDVKFIDSCGFDHIRFSLIWILYPAKNEQML